MSHNCDKTQAQVYLYLDQEMSLWRRFRIWVHLKRCPPCGDGFAFEQRLRRRIHDDCVEEPPRELYDRLWTFLREHETDGGTDVA